MKLKGKLGHLSYCTNIHPGESWEAVFEQLKRNLPKIKQGLSPRAPFGIGLRLSALAAQTLANADELSRFKTWLAEEDLYVFTINGFPYGKFHGDPVKQGVYRPDWSQKARLDYSIQLAEILAELTPNGQMGSISSIPGAFKPDIKNADYRAQIVRNLIQLVAHLHQLREKTGRTICFALEPEPSCMLETTQETLDFFSNEIHAPAQLEYLASLIDTDKDACIASLRRHLGVCLDTCHAAVMFEDPLASAQTLLAAKINIAKIQLTAALSVDEMNAQTLEAFKAFSDPIYLHQTCVQKSAGEMKAKGPAFFLDLPVAIAQAESTFAGSRDANMAESWRSHYHVPVFLKDLGVFQTTSDSLARLLAAHRTNPLTTHLELETYTFDVLPEQYRQTSVSDNIYRELAWVLQQLECKS